MTSSESIVKNNDSVSINTDFVSDSRIVRRLRQFPPLRWLHDAWRDLDEQMLGADSSRKAFGGSSLTLYIFVVVIISLILQEYLGGPEQFLAIVQFIDSLNATENPFLFLVFGWLQPKDGQSVYQGLADYWKLWNLLYWASWRVFGFFVIPLLAIWIHPSLKFGEMGLSTKGFTKHLWIYGILFLPVLAAVVVVSYSEEFSTYYPFYADAHRSLFDFLMWEMFYIAQFFSLEFFFRGFMLQPLRRTIGSNAIWAMMIPYVMIHFGKPMLECFGAIIAGVILGFVALRTRSIWGGVFIHVSVALSMDLAAIIQTHGIERIFKG